jgi:hypothetical protein
MMKCHQARWRSLYGQFTAFLFVACAANVYSSLAAVAAPPLNPDPRLAPWFEQLSRPWGPYGAKIRCCGIADCRVTDFREIAGHFEVLIDERFPGVVVPSWQPVPSRAILEYKDNPTGGAVACWHIYEVLCFVRPVEG